MVLVPFRVKVKVKTNTSKSKKATVKTKSKKRSPVGKTATAKSSAKRTRSKRRSPVGKTISVKKTTKKVVKKSPAKKATVKTKSKKRSPVGKTSTTKKVEALRAFNLKKFSNNKTNMIKLLVLLVVMGAVYLVKDVFLAATVDGAPIFRWSVINRLEEQGGRQILDSLVTEKLIKQAVKKSGVVVEQDEIDASLAEIETRLAAQGMDLEQALIEQGMTREELMEDIILQKGVEQAVANDTEITDEEVDAYISENKEFFPEGTDETEVREDVREQLKSLSLNEKIQTWVQDLQDNAAVIYFKEYEKAGL